MTPRISRGISVCSPQLKSVNNFCLVGKLFLKDSYENFVWIFCLDILFGYIGLMLAEKFILNLIQKDLLLSFTTQGSILSFVILTFWGADSRFWGPILNIFGTYTHIYTYTNIHIHTYIHTHIYTYTCIYIRGYQICMTFLN